MASVLDHAVLDAVEANKVDGDVSAFLSGGAADKMLRTYPELIGALGIDCFGLSVDHAMVPVDKVGWCHCLRKTFIGPSQALSTQLVKYSGDRRMINAVLLLLLLFRRVTLQISELWLKVHYTVSLSRVDRPQLKTAVLRQSDWKEETLVMNVYEQELVQAQSLPLAVNHSHCTIHQC